MVHHATRRPIAQPASDGDAVTYDVRDLANFTLDYAEECGLELTNLSLQKLLYFTHGWFYSIFEEPLVKNKFEAWQYGPVQRVIYDQFKICRDSPVRGLRAKYIDPLTGQSEYRAPKIDPNHAFVIRCILDKYTKYSASELVRESHAEDSPWEYVWKQAEDTVYPGMKIPDALILDHFQRLTPILTLH